jgi:hypothetical protein
MSADPVLTTARSQWAAGQPWWARPLATALETRRRGAALTWALVAVRELLPELRTEGAEDLRADLDRLEAFHEGRQEPEGDLLALAEGIWYGPRRDDCRTSVSRLFAALAYLWRGESSGYVKEVASALSVVGRHERFRPEMLERILRASATLLSTAAP